MEISLLDYEGTVNKNVELLERLFNISRGTLVKSNQDLGDWRYIR